MTTNPNASEKTLEVLNRHHLRLTEAMRLLLKVRETFAERIRVMDGRPIAADPHDAWIVPLYLMLLDHAKKGNP